MKDDQHIENFYILSMRISLCQPINGLSLCKLSPVEIMASLFPERIMFGIPVCYPENGDKCTFFSGKINRFVPARPYRFQRPFHRDRY